MIAKSLNELFESPAKVKILKLFLLNPDEVFNLGEVVKRSQVSREQCRRCIQKFVRLGLIKTVRLTSDAKKAKKKKVG